MPEGHTIHRLARQHAKLLGGRALAASSPQGRAAGAAAAIDGRVLERIDPYGKHLLYRFGDDTTLHVHLGLYGRFTKVAEPRGTPRLRLQAGDATVQLTGPTACHLIAPPDEDRLLARLGPDPLRRDADPEAAWAALRRRRIPLGAALLDQAVLAGVGNVYRAEALHVRRLDPLRPSRELAREDFDLLWGTITAQLTDGVRRGRIRTDPRRGGRHFVYRRTHCATCGGPVATAEVAARTLYWCPACQTG
jgi:formamidopyrimidine-DNA glycosylase